MARIIPIKEYLELEDHLIIIIEIVFNDIHLNINSILIFINLNV